MKIFGTVRQKIFDGKSWYSPLLIHKLFRYQKFSETQHRRVSLWNSSALWDKKFSTENLNTPPSLLSRNFSLPEFFWNTDQKGSSTKLSGTVRQKKFDTKSWYSPSPLIHKLFRYQKIYETKKGSPTEFFGTVRQQIFCTKSWYSPLRHKFFRYPKFSETQTGSSTKFFGTVRKKFFNRK